MYSNLDKAIVAAVMAAVQVANVLGFHWGLSEATVTTIVAAMTPVLVWAWPNAPKDS